MLQRPGKAGTAGAQHAAAAPGKRRGRPPKQQQQQQQRRQQRWDNEEESAEEEEEEEEEEEQQQAAPRRRPGRPPKQQAQCGQRAQQATLTGGRQRRPASAAAAVLGDASSSGAWVQLEPSAEALEASKQQGGIYEAGGAGHERGVYAWDGEPLPLGCLLGWSIGCSAAAMQLPLRWLAADPAAARSNRSAVYCRCPLPCSPLPDPLLSSLLCSCCALALQLVYLDAACAGKASTMRPVGPWLADKDTVRGTVLVRIRCSTTMVSQSRVLVSGSMSAAAAERGQPMALPPPRPPLTFACRCYKTIPAGSHPTTYQLAATQPRILRGCLNCLLQGRVGRLDKRHLADREALPGYRSPYVPGWIGVRTVDDSHWTPDYE